MRLQVCFFAEDLWQAFDSVREVFAVARCGVAWCVCVCVERTVGVVVEVDKKCGSRRRSVVMSGVFVLM